ncbi:MAG: DUF5668 domain-containing protein [Bdellovibrionia bacterium]
MKDGKTCNCCCPCHMMKGILIILFGLTFLLGTFEVLSQHVVSIIWPILVILAGGSSLMQGKCKCCDGSSMIGDKKA